MIPPVELGFNEVDAFHIGYRIAAGYDVPANAEPPSYRYVRAMMTPEEARRCKDMTDDFLNTWSQIGVAAWCLEHMISHARES